jgi:hypothetical protein
MEGACTLPLVQLTLGARFLLSQRSNSGGEGGAWVPRSGAKRIFFLRCFEWIGKILGLGGSKYQLWVGGQAGTQKCLGPLGLVKRSLLCAEKMAVQTGDITWGSISEG